MNTGNDKRMLEVQHFDDALKMLLGSTVSFVGGVWAWLGTNQQSIGAMCAVLGAVYATFYFIHWLNHLGDK